MKKRFQFRMLFRQIVERFATLLLGLVCLILIIHYWPADSDAQTRRSQGGLVSKVIVLVDGERMLVLQKKSSTGISYTVSQTVRQIVGSIAGQTNID